LNRKIKLFVLAVMSIAIFSVPGAVPLTGKVVAANSAATGISTPTRVLPAASSKVNDLLFEGCWTFFSAGPCRAIYRDAEGNYYICGKCDSGGSPGPGSCSQISPQTLQIGFWCS
jgi:hypothetical protein